MDFVVGNTGLCLVEIELFDFFTCCCLKKCDPKGVDISFKEVYIDFSVQLSLIKILEVIMIPMRIQYRIQVVWGPFKAEFPGLEFDFFLKAQKKFPKWPPFR